MSKATKNATSYRTAAILYFIAGLIFIIGSILGDRASTALIGIPFILLGMASWTKSRKLKDDEQKNPSE